MNTIQTSCMHSFPACFNRQASQNLNQLLISKNLFVIFLFFHFDNIILLECSASCHYCDILLSLCSFEMKETQSEEIFLKKQNFIWNLFKKSVELEENKADSDLQVGFINQIYIYLYFASLFFCLLLLIRLLIIMHAGNGVYFNFN